MEGPNDDSNNALYLSDTRGFFGCFIYGRLQQFHYDTNNAPTNEYQANPADGHCLTSANSHRANFTDSY
jgi:hypothetical protein